MVRSIITIGWISPNSSVQPKLVLTYPCEWPYVVIGASEDDLRMAIAAIVGDRTHTVSLSHSSAKGNYVSLKVLAVVRTEEDRLGIYNALNDHPATKVVI
jgi:putative lipoic acid-binding regulatory protein